MRADVNVSVRRPGGDFGTRCEIKNVNSIRFIGQAIETEAPPDRDPRRWRLDRSGDAAVRSKQGRDAVHALEGRGARLPLFPDPDLLPLEFDQAYVDELARHLPELPDDKKARLIEKLGLSAYDASVLVSEKAIADYFELVAEGRDGKLAVGHQRAASAR
jgi:aspartyl-tRNA(Asn)/glutamyl-tRNA(Gln) amidotransferase subunit B